MSLILLCWLLPFYAWPLRMRAIAWVACGLSIGAALHSVRLVGSQARSVGFAALSESAQQALDAARHRLEALPTLRLDGGDIIRRTGQRAPDIAQIDPDGASSALAVFIDAVPANEVATAPERADDPVSTAALLAWLEQMVLASNVALRRFEPVHEEVALRLMPPAYTLLPPSLSDSSSPSLSDTSSGVSILHRSADIEVIGMYPGLYSLMDRLARSEPPLIIVSSLLRSDDRMLRWQARVVVADTGIFRLDGALRMLGTASAGAGVEQLNDGAPADPFSRFGALSAVGSLQTARLIGVMRLGSRRMGFFSFGGHRYALEAGAILGDARVAAIHMDDDNPRAELLPLSGEASCVLPLRSAK